MVHENIRTATAAVGKGSRFCCRAGSTCCKIITAILALFAIGLIAGGSALIVKSKSNGAVFQFA